jgi:hypothetical protein
MGSLAKSPFLEYSGEIAQASAFLLDIRLEKSDGVVVGGRGFFQKLKVLTKELNLGVEFAIWYCCPPSVTVL